FNLVIYRHTVSEIAEMHYGGDLSRRLHPLDCPPHLAPAGVAAARVRVVGAAHRHHLPGGVALDTRALDDVGVAQAHLGTGREPEVLRRRRIAEVVLLDIQDAGEGHSAAAGRRVLGVVESLHLPDLTLRIVIDQYGC